MAPLHVGTSFVDIDQNQTDKKSPVDDDLMYAIGEDLYYLKNTASSAGGLFEWKVNGNLSILQDDLPFKRIDGAFVAQARTIANHNIFLELAGESGTLEVDVRKYRSVATPITEIAYQYTDSISSITRAGTSINTQSITRATAQIATQSITFWKASINVNSIVPLGGGLTRYNLASAPDSDWIEDSDYVTFAGCTSGANNGTFKLIKRNEDSGNNVIVQNAAGVVQTSAAGSAQLQAMSYNLVNPASTEFVATEKADFNSHTDSNNNGKKTIYAINQAGNNIIVKNQLGATQGGVAGTIDVLRFTYTYSSSVGADYVVGEKALFASHTSSVNDGNHRITAVNSGGNNLIVYNENGATQGGVAGTADTNRWIYALPTDPTSSFSVGQTFRAIGATAVANNGIFTVVQINRSATNNLVIYNEAGVTQGGSAGNIYHTRKIVKFATDESAIYSTLSRVNIINVGSSLNKGEFVVLQVNRGGGANYNVVVDIPTGVSQASPSGRINFESRSIFSTRPTLTSTDDLSYSSNGTLDATEKTIAAGRTVMIEILQIPDGSPENLTVQIS